MRMKDSGLKILAIFAHPDDGDLKMGATAAMMSDAGHHVKFVSLTNGDAGHYQQGGDVLAQRRRAEVQEAAGRLGIDEYTVMDYHDGELTPTLNIRLNAIREIRKWKADVVFGLRPWDYHPDHRYAGILVQDAAYMVQVPHVVPDTPSLEWNPVFLYMEDGFQKPYPFSHDIVIGVDSHIDRKIDALDAHESQMYEWLAWVEGQVDEVPETASERLEWLKRRWVPEGVSDEQRRRLIEGYGKKQGSAFDYAESFEICEYGRQPSQEDLEQIFPMLNQ